VSGAVATGRLAGIAPNVTMVLPAGSEEAHVLGHTRGGTPADFSTTSWQSSQ